MLCDAKIPSKLQKSSALLWSVFLRLCTTKRLNFKSCFFLLLLAHCYAAGPNAVREKKKDDLKFNLRFIMKSRRKYFTLKPNLFASCRCREICKNVCILSLFLDVLFYFCTSRRALDKRNKIEL